MSEPKWTDHADLVAVVSEGGAERRPEPSASDELFSAARDAYNAEAGSLVVAVYETGAWLATCLESILRELSRARRIG